MYISRFIKITASHFHHATQHLLNKRFVGIVASSLVLSACAYHPNHIIPPGNSAYGHAQGNGPHHHKGHKFKKASHIQAYGTVDVGYGYRGQKYKHK